MIRKLIWLILSVIVAVILFILIISLFPSRKKSVNIVNMSYIFIDDDWTEYDIFEPIHWAVRDWSFLFWKKKSTETPENSDWENNWDKWNQLWNKDYVGSSDSWHEVGEDQFNLPEWAIEKPLPKDCETPRWTKVLHDESILAYQQRSDVPDICNVQKRTCNDGILDWSFYQPSCNENVIYVWNNSSNSINTSNEWSNGWSNNVVSYTKKVVVSHNNASKSELIQTPKYGKNEWAEFDTKWKLKNWEKQPITKWDNNDKYWIIGNYESEEQLNFEYKYCKTPRGEVVNHWQFVRAYELPYWFTNASCKIELRLCVDWELKWSFEYQDCEYLDITYEEYDSISQLREDKNLRTKIKNLFE